MKTQTETQVTHTWTLSTKEVVAIQSLLYLVRYATKPGTPELLLNEMMHQIKKDLGQQGIRINAKDVDCEEGIIALPAKWADLYECSDMREDL